MGVLDRKGFHSVTLEMAMSPHAVANCHRPDPLNGNVSHRRRSVGRSLLDDFQRPFTRLLS